MRLVSRRQTEKKRKDRRGLREERGEKELNSKGAKDPKPNGYITSPVRAFGVLRVESGFIAPRTVR